MPCTVNNSSASGTVTVSDSDCDTFIGGLIGYSQVSNADTAESIVNNCISSVDVSATASEDYIRGGGLVGCNRAGTITGCHASGSIYAKIYTDSDTNTNDGGYVGGLVGLNHYNGTIADCYATGDIRSAGGSPKFVGGLVGGNGYSSSSDDTDTIRNCYAAGDVTSTGGDHLVCVGGLVGRNCTAGTSDSPANYGTSLIEQCYATGDVYGLGGGYNGDDATVRVGGLVGRNYTGSGAVANGVVRNCYARGSATAGSYTSSASVYAAGFVGGNYTEAGSGYNSMIENCYSTGIVQPSEDGSATVYCYGFCGYLHNSQINNSFWDYETSNITTSNGGTGKTTAEMQTRSLFINNWWDFINETANGTDDIWRMAGYPVLNGLGEGAPTVRLIRAQGNSESFFTIQAAIDDANDFDQVVADPGTYNEQINFLGKAITVRSTDANDWDVVAATIINANDLTDETASVTFEAGEDANSVLAGFTVTGGDYGICVKGQWPNLPSPTLQQCIIEETGSVGVYCEDARPVICNNIIRNIPGQGIYVQYNNQLTIRNNILHDNDDAIQICNNNDGQVSNNTIAENTTGISDCTIPPILTNCIFWDNSLFSLADGFTATYSCLDDLFDGTDPNFIGSISGDPNFVDPSGNIFNLTANSPCIDAGDPNGVYTGQTDIEGDDRVLGTAVDIGADEY